VSTASSFDRCRFPDEARLVRVFTVPPGATEVRSRNPLASVDFVCVRERSRTLDQLEVIWQRERGLTGAGDSMIVKTSRWFGRGAVCSRRSAGAPRVRRSAGCPSES